MINIGLLLSRAAGFLLAFTFGLQKIGWYVTAFHAGKPLASVGLAPLIAKVGFPFPIILALWITLNDQSALSSSESVFSLGSQQLVSI